MFNLFDIRKIRKRPEKRKYKTDFRQILAYMLVPFKGLFIFTLVLSIAQSLLFVSLPLIAGNLVQEIIDGNLSALTNNFAFLFIFMILMAVVMFIRLYSNQFMGNSIIKNLRVDIFKAIQRSSYGFLDYHATGDLMARSTSDLNLLQALLSSQITMFVRQALTVAVALIAMGIINFTLSLYIYPLFPVIFLIIYRFKKKMAPAFKESRQMYGHLTAAVEENITGVRVVRSFATEDYEIEKFKKHNKRYLSQQYILMKLQVSFNPVVRLVVNAAILIIVFVGGNLLIKQQVTLGSLFAFILLLNFAVDPLFFINTFLGNMSQIDQICWRITTILNNEEIIPEKLGIFELTAEGKTLYEALEKKKREQELKALDEDSKMLIMMVGDGLSELDKICDKTMLKIDEVKKIFDRNRKYLKFSGAETLEDIKGIVEFNNVSLSYRHNDFHELKNISFKTKPGEIIAILGATGSGKTSIIRLIGRFYEADKGTITIDRKDIKDITKKSLRDNIGFVLQESFLFSRSLRENLIIGRPEATIEEVIQACKLANIHNFIDSLPEKYETVVGQRGVTLSGGQRQRVSIARALIKKPKILVLDDATSSVDVDTEFKIQQAFSTMFKDCTTFIITQRLSTVRNADRIIVLNNGEIAEFDTHENLMNDPKGIYHKLYTTLKVDERAEV